MSENENKASEVKTDQVDQLREFANKIMWVGIIAFFGWAVFNAFLIPIFNATFVNIWQLVESEAAKGAFLGAVISGAIAGGIFLADLIYRRRQFKKQVEREEKNVQDQIERDKLKAMSLFTANFQAIVGDFTSTCIRLKTRTERKIGVTEIPETTAIRLKDLLPGILTLHPHFPTELISQISTIEWAIINGQIYAQRFNDNENAIMLRSINIGRTLIDNIILNNLLPINSENKKVFDIYRIGINDNLDVIEKLLIERGEWPPKTDQTPPASS